MWGGCRMDFGSASVDSTSFTWKWWGEWQWNDTRRARCHEELGRWGAQADLFCDVAQIALDQRAWDHFDGASEAEYLSTFDTHPNMGISSMALKSKVMLMLIQTILFSAQSTQNQTNPCFPPLFFTLRLLPLHPVQSPSHLRPFSALGSSFFSAPARLSTRTFRTGASPQPWPDLSPYQSDPAPSW